MAPDRFSGWSAPEFACRRAMKRTSSSTPVELVTSMGGKNGLRSYLLAGGRC
jgi:hypothetical protein